MGEVRLDDDRLGRMGFRTRPNHQIWLSENYGGETILTTAKNGYFLNRFEGYREMSD